METKGQSGTMAEKASVACKILLCG